MKRKKKLIKKYYRLRHVLVYPSILCEMMKDNNHNKVYLLLIYKEYILRHFGLQTLSQVANLKEHLRTEMTNNVLFVK
jgi:hypothetical protein